jgi:hypothetical protein
MIVISKVLSIFLTTFCCPFTPFRGTLWNNVTLFQGSFVALYTFSRVASFHFTVLQIFVSLFCKFLFRHLLKNIKKGKNAITIHSNPHLQS